MISLIEDRTRLLIAFRPARPHLAGITSTMTLSHDLFASRETADARVIMNHIKFGANGYHDTHTAAEREQDSILDPRAIFGSAGGGALPRGGGFAAPKAKQQT